MRLDTRSYGALTRDYSILQSNFRSSGGAFQQKLEGYLRAWDRGRPIHDKDIPSGLGSKEISTADTLGRTNPKALALFSEFSTGFSSYTSRARFVNGVSDALSNNIVDLKV